jgi:hypothetical protein
VRSVDHAGAGAYVVEFDEEVPDLRTCVYAATALSSGVTIGANEHPNNPRVVLVSVRHSQSYTNVNTAFQLLVFCDEA